MEHDLTISEVLADPLIMQLRNADSISFAAFAQLMESAARVHTRQLLSHLDQQRVDAFYRSADAAAQKTKSLS